MKATYFPYQLTFKQAAGTSRGVLHQKETWFLVLQEGTKIGIGECGLLRGLSMDDVPNYEEQLKWVCQNIHLGKVALWKALQHFPSIQMGVEMAFLDLEASEPFLLFPSLFTQNIQNIAINGLVWMGTSQFMKEQIAAKLAAGFTCIKLKIGAIDFETELSLLHAIRKEYNAQKIEIRVDANGAFLPHEAMNKLKALSVYDLHSIEQPIAANQSQEMATLCQETPIPIALDEELIGCFGKENKQALLQKIQPQYIILKPSLVGGFTGTDEWIAAAESQNIPWWITSALESNIGLNAIAQYTFTKNNNVPQGLGTGGLYTNNVASPLYISNGFLGYDTQLEWDISPLQIQ